MGTPADALPYWQVNVPPHERTATCPDFLVNVSPKDRGILSTPDSQYTPDTWASAQHKVASNQLNLFQRTPSELRLYLAFAWAIKRDYGSVLDFILTQRLRWAAPVVPRSSIPFACEDEDVKVLRNDWPYGVDKRIVHLVVWTKFELEEDPATGDLADGARRAIEAYVRRTFAERGVAEDRVIWFKNWRSLKSVQAVEHFHVMLFDPDPEFVREVTHGDVAMCDRAEKWDDAQGAV
ncbi:hypothetical protein B0T22DRAFT_507921 [Podospora appendiculata]|uniref:N-acetylglucosamine-induced protein 1 n=1 Tax=Podospora appendiculata TaxID=314037 RepID=A0AAE0XKA4_9PEZI|nr:hypothetical protein B0T22DRAFT_507921 [Podospora appendiculata]